MKFKLLSLNYFAFILFFLFSCNIAECPICKLNTDISGKWWTEIYDSNKVISFTLNISLKNEEIGGNYTIKLVDGNFASHFSSSIFGEYFNEHLTFVSTDTLISFDGYYSSNKNKIEGNIKIMQKGFLIELVRI